MTAYYNEIDPYAAQWLRNLIDAGLIAAGDVDDRSIADVHPADLLGYDQCHFFAGLGGWSRALRLAGWPDDRPVWTGSCPCQPFSTAGKRKGFADSRHLWPEWFRLIRQCCPPIVFGEQVASASEWFGLVRRDLEEVEYAVGAMPIEAASVGANHKRDRLWFVAHSRGKQYEGHRTSVGRETSAELPPADPIGRELRQQPGRRSGADGAGAAQPGEHGAARDVANPHAEGCTDPEGLSAASSRRGGRQPAGMGGGVRGAIDFWRTEPDVGRVAHGVPSRVAKLRALGNAIVPQVAAEFISCVM